MNKSPVLSKANLVPLILIGAGLLLAFTRPVYSLISPATLDLKITQAPVVMPAVYKVYENEEALEGKYSLFKMVMTNNSSHAAENVEVSVEIPKIMDKEVIQKYETILPGQTVVVNCYPHLPASIVERTTSSKENVKITVSGKNIKTQENDFGITFKGRNEFVYTFIPPDEIRTGAETFDNKELLSCFITPEDPIIKYFTQQVQEKLLKGEAAAVNNKEEEGVRVMMGIYDATLRSHFVYSGTSGVPEKVGDASTITQSLRLPREVVSGKTGLCIELSLLHASMMMCVGMDPIIFLVPGHAYPGFKMNGNWYAIESTGVNGEGLGGTLSAQQAYQKGMESLKTCLERMQMGDPQYTFLDVREAIKNGAIAMELKDDNFLRQKVDEIGKTFAGANIPQNVNTNYGVNTGGNTGGGGGNDGGGGGNDGSGGGGGSNVPNGYKSYSGIVSFAYPSSWRAQKRTQYTISQNVVTYANANNTLDVEVYKFDGYSTGDQALNYIRQKIESWGLGMSLQYQKVGAAGGYTLYRGVSGNQDIQINWVGAFKKSGNGVVGITVGADSNVNGESVTTNILNTLQ